MQLKRIHELLDGLRDSWRFSNRFGLVWQRLAGRRLPVVHYEWRNQWHLYCDPRVGDHGSVKEVLAQGVYDGYIRRSSRSGSLTYMNVGANVGAFDVAVAAQQLKVPYALTVELNPWTFSRLAFNVSANRLNSLRLCNAGVAGASGSFSYALRADSVTDSIFSEGAAPGVDVREVALLTLEDALTSVGLRDRPFDLLKLDAECAEYDIVETVTPGLIRKFAHIVMELHTPPPGRSPERLYAKLAACGFVGGEPAWKADEPPALRFWTRVE